MTDNSFLVEEAFNQDPKVFQNIFGFMRQSGDWQMVFTQEWPRAETAPSALLHAVGGVGRLELRDSATCS